MPLHLHECVTTTLSKVTQSIKMQHSIHLHPQEQQRPIRKHLK